MKVPEADSSRPTALALLLLSVMIGSAPLARAADLSRFDSLARVDAEALRASANSVRQGRYQEPQHLAASAALTNLQGAIDQLPPEAAASDKLEAALLQLKDATADALKTEDQFWSGLSEQVKSGEAPAAPQAAADLVSKIEAIASILDKLSQESAAPARPSGTPVQTAAVHDTSAGAEIVAHVQDSGATSPARSDRFWDNAAHRRTDDGAAVLADGARKKRRVRTTVAPKPGAIDVPALGDGMTRDRVSSCRDVLADRTSIAGLCQTQPEIAVMIGGMADAVKEQFGTLRALATMAVIMLGGLLLTAVSGLGVIARIGALVLAAGMTVAAVVGLLQRGQQALGDWLSAAPGSREKALALRRLGQTAGTALIIVAMAALGNRAGKAWPVQLAATKAELLYVDQVFAAGEQQALEEKLPTSVQNALVKVFGYPAASVTISTPLPPEPAAPAELAPAELAALLEKAPDRAREFARVQFEQDMVKTPDGLPERYQPGVEAIRRLLGDQQRVTRLMQDLETEIILRSQKSGEPLEISREKVLTEWEARNGFKPAVDLPGKTYDTDEWRAMLREGAMFKDTVFKDVLRQGFRHGYETHRVQWNLVMREMAARPESFGNVASASELFKFTGAVDDASLNWERTGLSSKSRNKTIWYQLFDSNEKNFSSPEFFRDQHRYFPGLGGWY